MKTRHLVAALATASLSFATWAQARVFFIEPKDGAMLSGEFTIRMGVEGMQVQPAGETVEGAGHHHVIIDGAPVPKGQTIVADEQNVHLGKGQTETTLKLPNGVHTLTLQFADGLHRSYGPEMSQTINVYSE